MKRLLSLLIASVMIMCLSVTAFAIDEEPPIPPDPDEPYLYTREISSYLSFTGNKATCISEVIGYPSQVTKIEITQTLQQTFNGASWYYIASWNKTYYSTTALYINTKTPMSSGNYRVKTEAKVYNGSSYETILSYSTTVTY